MDIDFMDLIIACESESIFFFFFFIKKKKKKRREYIYLNRLIGKQ